QSAHWRGDQDQGGAGAEISGWKSAEGFGKLVHSAAGRGSAARPQRRSRPARLARVLSSVGRASPLQGECREFEPLSTHQQERASEFAGVVVQLVRKQAWHGGGRGFESRPLRHKSSAKKPARANKQHSALTRWRSQSWSSVFMATTSP